MIDCVTALGTSLKKYYLGEIINHQDILTTKLEISFVDPTVYPAGHASEGQPTEQVQTWLTKINNNSQNIGEWQASITISGGGPYTLTYTNCRISSVDIPTSPEVWENAIDRGKIYLTIEEKVNGNSYCRADDTANQNVGDTYAGIETQISAVAEYLQDIAENFSFKSEVAGQWSYEHSVTVNLQETLSSNLSGARNVCQNILNANAPNFGFAFNAAKYNTSSTTITPYYSESFDLENGQYTLSKSFNLYEDVAGEESTYTYNLTHSVKRDSAGIMTITEKGKVKGRTGTKSASAEAGVNTLLTGAYSRCNTIYLEYLEAGAAANLNNITLVEEKNIDNISQEHSYTVSYSNDSAYISSTAGEYRRESTITASLDSVGNVVMRESVNIKTKEQKGFPDLTSNGPLNSVGFLGADPSVTLSGTVGRNLFLTDFANSSSRVHSFYEDIKYRWVNDPAAQASNSGLGADKMGLGGYSFKRVKTTLEFAALGKNLSYVAEYTSDPELTAPGFPAHDAGVRRISMEVQDEVPQAMNSEYAIPGWKFLVHNSNQTALGSRTVTARMTCARPNYNRFVPIPDVAGGAYNNVEFRDTIPISEIAYGAKMVKNELQNWANDLGLPILMCPLTNQPLQYLENVSYDFDSSGTASVTGTIKYVQSNNGLTRDADGKATGGRSNVWP